MRGYAPVVLLCALAAASTTRRGVSQADADWVEKVLSERNAWNKTIQRCVAQGPTPTGPKHSGQRMLRAYRDASPHRAEAYGVRMTEPDAPLDEFSDVPYWLWHKLRAEEAAEVRNEPAVEIVDGSLEIPSGDYRSLRQKSQISEVRAVEAPSVDFKWARFREQIAAARAKKIKDMGLTERDLEKFRPLLTSATCKPTVGSDWGSGDAGTHTCLIKNLYFENGLWTAHVLQEKDLPNVKVQVKTGKFQPLREHFRKIVQHGTLESFAFFLKQTGAVQELKGVSLALWPQWHFNIGHLLYDTLYPNFLSLIQWDLTREMFRPVFFGGWKSEGSLAEDKYPGAMARNSEVLSAFGGLELVRDMYDLKRKTTYRFETIVLGCGVNLAKVDMNANFTLGGARELDAPRLMRDRFYRHFGLGDPSAGAAAAAAEAAATTTGDPSSGVGRHRRLKGILVLNKRFGSTVPSWIGTLFERAKEIGVDLRLIDWSKVGRNKTCAKKALVAGANQFKCHMEIMSRTDIHISGPGTAMMYQQFLPDGRVHVNLGEIAMPPPSNVMDYMEEYIAEASTHFRALYHWPTDVEYGHGRADMESLVRTVEAAKRLVLDGFPRPVPRHVNLSPVTQVIKAYVYLTQGDRGALARLAPLEKLRSPLAPQFRIDCLAQSFPQAHFFVEPCDVYPRGTPGRPCALDRCLLSELTRSFGSPCPGCRWDTNNCAKTWQ